MEKEDELKQFQLDLEKQYQEHLSKYAHSWSSERLPLYVDKANYNTNAPSYYDYLARMLNYMLGQLEYAVNRTLRRNIKFTDTFSIDFSKIGDWVNNGKCLPNNFDDVIDISAVVNISEQTETIEFNYLKLKEFVIANGSKIKSDGVWSPDYIDVLKQLDNEIHDINNELDDINHKIDIINQTLVSHQNQINDINTIINQMTDKYDNILQKIIDNLFASGGVTTNNINNFQFTPNRNIATGTINLFSSVDNGQSFIRTQKDLKENDLIGGI